MRPAREGRENPPERPPDLVDVAASMRPAREGRENDEQTVRVDLNKQLQ